MDVDGARVVVLDNGGDTIKSSVVNATGESSVDAVVTNCIASSAPSDVNRWLMGKQLDEYEVSHGSSKLRYVRPIEKGYCINWNVETALWSHLFSKELNVNTQTHGLVATSPLFTPSKLLQEMDEVVFEEFGFASFSRVPSAEMTALAYSQSSDTSFKDASCKLVVDTGYSFTHVIPLIDNRVYFPGVKRMNVGGKLLTNYLKEVVSARQWDVQSQPRIVNEAKESVCYVSLDFQSDMQSLYQNRHQRVQWLLPDFVDHFRGRRVSVSDVDMDPEQITTLDMGIERVAVPELLFRPSDLSGMKQKGLAETIVEAVENCPRELHGSFMSNVLVTGGNANFENFTKRLERELRPMVDATHPLHIYESPSVLTTLEGCKKYAVQEERKNRTVLKREYEDYGSNICQQRFT